MILDENAGFNGTGRLFSTGNGRSKHEKTTENRRNPSILQKKPK